MRDAQAPDAPSQPTALPEAGDAPVPPSESGGLSRRTLLRVGASGAALGAFYAAGSTLGPLESRGLLSADGVFDATAIELADSLYTEAFPTSPVVLSPFTDPLPIPQVLAPSSLPDAGKAKQSNLAKKDGTYQAHQCWSDDAEIIATNGGQPYPEPVQYHLKIQVAEHAFTTSKVLPIDINGQPTTAFDKTGKAVAVDPKSGTDLPKSTIYGFNGIFPGPAIHARYGRPALVRFDNQLGDNPNKYPTMDFGAPDKTFLTHLHNGHTAPESDGNPHYFFDDFKDVGATATARARTATTCT